MENHWHKIFDKWVWLLILIISFGIYVFNIYPEITNGDSGEFLSASYTLGIAHPPGYPLYLVLLKIFIWILPFNPALSGNIMSAFFASLAVVFVYKNLLLFYKIIFGKEMLFNIKIVTLFLALFTGIIPLIFSQAIITEVYTLNLFLMLLINFVFFKIIIYKKLNFIYLFAFLYGISLTNHQTPILLLPVYVIILYYGSLKNFEKHRRHKLIINAVLLFFVGLFIYSYLLIRASSNPVINWGNPSNFVRFFQHITRSEYKEMKLVKERSFIYFIKQCIEYFKLLWQQLGILTLLSIAGIYISFRKNYKTTILTLIFWFILSIGFVYITNPRIDRHILYVSRVFFIPSFVIMIFWLFICIVWLIQKIKYLIVLPVIIFFIAYFVNVKSEQNNFIAYDFSKNVLKTVNKNSALFTVEGDNPLFALAYLRYVEYLRPDIDYCNRYGKMFMSSAEYFKNLISIDTKELYFTSPERIQPEYQKYIKQFGIIYKLLLKHQNYDFINYYYLRTGAHPKDYMDKGLTAIYYYRLAQFYKEYLNNEDEYYRNLNLSAEFGDELKDIQNLLGRLYYSKKDYKKAKKFFKRVIKIAPEDATGYFYYGMCELKENNFEVSLKYLMEAYNRGMKTAGLYKALAFNLYKLRRVYEAIIYLEEAIKLFPDNDSLKQALKYYNSIIE